MKKIIILGISLFFISYNLCSQSDYVLTKNNDTINAKIINWDQRAFVIKVYCDINGEIKKFKAKNLIEFKSGEQYYEVCRVNLSLIGFKRKAFLRRYIKGNISLYGTSVTDYFRNTHMQTNTVSYNSVTTSVIFIKKNNCKNPKYKKMFGYGKLRKATSDCDTYLKKYGKSVPSENYPFKEQIQFYNNDCK